MNNQETQLSYKSVFETLSKVDVTGKTEQKGNYTYLKWSYAWHIFNHYYPEVQVKWLEPFTYDNGTMILRCRVEIGELYKEGWLPVYDNKYNAIENPRADDIQDNMQRAMVKTMSLFGLALQLYHNGQTKPEELNLKGEINDPEVKKIAKAKDKQKAVESALKNGGINESTNEVELGQSL